MINSKPGALTKDRLKDLPWDIICDFDGTISLVDVTDTLLERFADPEWQDIERAWKDGLINSRQCLDQQIPLLDMSLVELNSHLDKIEIDPDFPAFVAEVQQHGHRITVVSDGLDYVIERILGRYGLTSLEIKANKLVQQGSRSWKVTFPNSHIDCQVSSGNCKCSVVEQHQHQTIKSYRSLLIGDGTSDFCAAGKVDFVFAKNALVNHCVEQRIPHYQIESFADVRSLLNADR
ncbi:MAG: MtnX-like HAD-IB family phosphatase [Prochloron sp. SP5CPC1]|nr:MtnX-like HAD-IB family phosphatase [Candidatus Paraprochloron terpiosi SP5CPC1]